MTGGHGARLVVAEAAAVVGTPFLEKSATWEEIPFLSFWFLVHKLVKEKRSEHENEGKR